MWTVRRGPACFSRCVATAAGPGSAIVPVSVGSQTASRKRAAPPRGPDYCQDEQLARNLQQDEDDLVAQAEASKVTGVKQAAYMATSMT